MHLVDAGLFNYIDKARDLDTAAYSYTYNGPGGNSNLCTALNTLSATLAAPTGAVEMWLYNAGNTRLTGAGMQRWQERGVLVTI